MQNSKLQSFPVCSLITIEATTECGLLKVLHANSTQSPLLSFLSRGLNSKLHRVFQIGLLLHRNM